MAHKTLVLPRQTTIYTCGAACLSAIAVLRGQDIKTEMHLASMMDAKPFVGIHNETLWNVARTMGADKCGENIWDGSSLAILNILNPLSGVGHYVVALRTLSLNGDVVVYCPYYANTLRLTKAWLDEHWISGDGQYCRWAITFTDKMCDDVMCIGDAWQEMGLAAGEINPHWLYRSADAAINRLKISLS